MIYFTSDLHFDHVGVIKMCNRPFNDVKEMNDYLIDKINSLVKTEDKLYHLGDLSWTNPEPFIKRINCRDITFIKGNHDKDSWHLEEYGEYKTQLYLKSHNIFLNHFPHAYWPCSHYGSFHLSGHLHAEKEQELDSIWPERRSMDVGVDNAKRLLGDYIPFSLDDIIRILGTRKGHHQIGA